MFVSEHQRRWIFGGAQVAVCLFFALAVFNVRAGSAQEDCQLFAGYGPEPPYHYPDEQGKIIGIDADILRIVLEDIGCRLTFDEHPWKRTLRDISTGKLDVTMGASYTGERAKFAHYSVPYRGQPHVVFENRKSASKTATLADFLNAGHSLGVVLGWHYTDEIRKLIDDPAYGSLVHVAPTFDSLLSMHDRGRFEGFLANPSVVAGEIGIQALREKYRMTKADVDILHFLFSRATVEAGLVARFNQRLAQRIEDGFFFDVCGKYEHTLISSCALLSTTDRKTGN
jgi:polar amino acid transport system substrate-binding protein